MQYCSLIKLDFSSRFGTMVRDGDGVPLLQHFKIGEKQMLMLKESEVRTRMQLDRVAHPEPTRSWHPVPFTRAVDVVEETLYIRGLDVVKATYGVARQDTQLFASWQVAGEHEAHHMTFALRGSLNKTLSWSIIAGLQVAACSNLDLWSGSFKAIRKNTVNVDRDMWRMVGNVVAEALPQYDRKAQQLEGWKAIPVSLDEGYGFLGRAFGHNVLNTRQLAAAAESWRESEVEEHRERNAYCLYAGLTEGLKRGPLGEAIGRYAVARDYFVGEVAP